MDGWQLSFLEFHIRRFRYFQLYAQICLEKESACIDNRTQTTTYINKILSQRSFNYVMMNSAIQTNRNVFTLYICNHARPSSTSDCISSLSHTVFTCAQELVGAVNENFHRKTYYTDKSMEKEQPFTLESLQACQPSKCHLLRILSPARTREKIKMLLIREMQREAQREIQHMRDCQDHRSSLHSNP